MRDLHLDLGRSGAARRLEQALREAVQTGRLAPGTRLPSSRALARDLGIARNTVAEAYTQLVAEGWLTARQGSGTRVPRRGRRGAGGGRRAHPRRPRPGASATTCGPGCPTCGVSRTTEWLAAARGRCAARHRGARLRRPAGPRRSCARASPAYLARDPRGARHAGPDRRLRRASRRARRCCARCRPDCGVRRLAVEAYGPAPPRGRRAAGLRLGRSRSTTAGAVWTRRWSAGAVLLTPAHQFPLGSRSHRRRAARRRWAAPAA